jgi:hypothetical protein
METISELNEYVYNEDDNQEENYNNFQQKQQYQHLETKLSASSTAITSNSVDSNPISTNCYSDVEIDFINSRCTTSTPMETTTNPLLSSQQKSNSKIQGVIIRRSVRPSYASLHMIRPIDNNNCHKTVDQNNSFSTTTRTARTCSRLL